MLMTIKNQENQMLTDLVSTFPIFREIDKQQLPGMLQCLGYHLETYKKGDYISMEGDHLQNIGIVVHGCVDMIKEDYWGNKTIILRMQSPSLFGETFICGSVAISAVTFEAVEETTIMFLPFKRVMHTCTNACAFHHRLIENLVQLIADKNLALMKKVEVVTKKTLREKILAYLSQQAQLQSSEYFEIPLGRLELAEYLCADRSALTRELNAMKSEGILDYDRNIFRIKK